MRKRMMCLISVFLLSCSLSLQAQYRPLYSTAANAVEVGRITTVSYGTGGGISTVSMYSVSSMQVALPQTTTFTSTSVIRSASRLSYGEFVSADDYIAGTSTPTIRKATPTLPGGTGGDAGMVGPLPDGLPTLLILALGYILFIIRKRKTENR